jgi:hypothetical protein
MIRAALTVLLTLCSSLLLVTPATADPSAKWKRINREDGITVYSKTVTGSDLVAVRGKTTIKQPLEKVLSVLMTHQRWGEWVDRMSSSKILKTISTYEYIVYQSFDMPAFVSNRDFVYRGTVTSNAKGQVILKMSSCKWKSAPETVGVRAKMMNSRYVLTPKGNDQTHVEVEIHADPKGLIPDWLVNQLQKSWPVGTLNGVRKQASRKDVKRFPAPPPAKVLLAAKPKTKVEAKAKK